MCVPLSESHRLCFCQDRVQSCCVPGSVYCIIIVCYGVFLGLCGIIIMWFISECVLYNYSMLWCLSGSVLYNYSMFYVSGSALYNCNVMRLWVCVLYNYSMLWCVSGSMYWIIYSMSGVFLGLCVASSDNSHHIALCDKEVGFCVYLFLRLTICVSVLLCFLGLCIHISMLCFLAGVLYIYIYYVLHLIFFIV